MKIIIAGDRYFNNKDYVFTGIRGSGFHITEIVSGGATGVDTLGEIYALENNLPLKRFPANWDSYGRAAGPIRNQQMANYADGIIAFLAQGSKGTQNMIDIARKKGLPMKIYHLTKPISSQINGKSFKADPTQRTLEFRIKKKSAKRSNRKCTCKK